MVNLSYQDRNLSMSIAIIYTQHYIITPAIPILNHQPHGFIFEIRRVIYKGMSFDIIFFNQYIKIYKDIEKKS